MRDKWIVRLLVAAVGAVALGASVIAVRAARAELASLEPDRYIVPRPAGEVWLAAATDMSLTTRKGVKLQAWRLASTNGSVVLLIHGSGANRAQLVPEARILSNAGYGVLMFDLPGSGESGGQKRRGDEQDFVRVAVDSLASAPDVRSGRIGGYGFSTGAALLADMAAQDTRLRAVVLAGCYTDTNDHIRHDYHRWGLLSSLPARWAARWAGLVPLHPLASVAAIAPRAVFFIQGDADPIVDSDSASRLYAAASEPKELWILPGAAHGGLYEAAGEEYPRRLVAFFDHALK